MDIDVTEVRCCLERLKRVAQSMAFAAPEMTPFWQREAAEALNECAAAFGLKGKAPVPNCSPSENPRE